MKQRHKDKISFDELCSKLKKIKFDKFDLIVSIGKGGITLGGLIQHILDIPMEIMWLNFRDEDHKVVHKKPILMKKFKVIEDKRILLVDDVSRTGATLKKAKSLLKGNKVKTFVFNGKADYSIINSKECVRLPWNMV